MRLHIEFKPETGLKPTTIKYKSFMVSETVLRVDTYSTGPYYENGPMGGNNIVMFPLSSIHSFESID